MTNEQTTLALRVLVAINNREKPSDADVLLLHLYCPGHDDMEPDELACLTIQEAIHLRGKLRILRADRNGTAQA